MAEAGMLSPDSGVADHCARRAIWRIKTTGTNRGRSPGGLRRLEGRSVQGHPGVSFRAVHAARREDQLSGRRMTLFVSQSTNRIDTRGS